MPLIRKIIISLSSEQIFLRQSPAKPKSHVLAAVFPSHRRHHTARTHTGFPFSLSSTPPTTEIANLPVQPHVGVHELAEARLRQNVRRRHPAGADVQGKVRTAHRVAQE